MPRLTGNALAKFDATNEIKSMEHIRQQRDHPLYSFAEQLQNNMGSGGPSHQEMVNQMQHYPGDIMGGVNGAMAMPFAPTIGTMINERMQHNINGSSY